MCELHKMVIKVHLSVYGGAPHGLVRCYAPWVIGWFRHYINRLIAYLSFSLLIYFFKNSQIGPFLNVWCGLTHTPSMEMILLHKIGWPCWYETESQGSCVGPPLSVQDDSWWCHGTSVSVKFRLFTSRRKSRRRRSLLNINQNVFKVALTCDGLQWQYKIFPRAPNNVAVRLFGSLKHKRLLGCWLAPPGPAGECTTNTQ